MPNLIIDNQTYDIDQLPEEAKAQVVSLQFVDLEIQRLTNTIAVFQTARNGYVKALMPHLASLEGLEIKPTQPH